MLQRNARAARHTEVRILGEDCFHASAAEDEFRHVAELARAAREDDAVVDNVAREFWRRLLENFANRVQNANTRTQLMRVWRKNVEVMGGSRSSGSKR